VERAPGAEITERGPPTWLDETRRPVPTHPCWRCGRELPVWRTRSRIRPQQVFAFETVVGWCGHPTTYVWLPGGGEWWYQVPVYGDQELRVIAGCI
jgi:hypothetical protein